MKFSRLKFATGIVLAQENFARVEAVEILAVPFAVVVAFAGRGGFEPCGKIVVDEHVQFKMHVRAVFGDDFGIGGAAHRRDDVAGLDCFADFQSGLDRAQVRVKRINFNALDDMADDEVIAVIRERGFRAEINHCAVGGGHDRIGRLAALAGLQMEDVETFMQPLAVVADAAEAAAGPRLVRRGRREKFQLAAAFKQIMVGRRELKRLLREKVRAVEK